MSKHIAYLFFVVLFVSSCAKEGVLTGGPKDEEPPKIVPKKSTPNFKTIFSEDKLVFEFDEFIQLRGLDKNLIISPPLKTQPKITQRGKKITIRLSDVELRPDVTYSMDFGNSIVDFNEGNPYEDFKYIFSTGDEIDSLTYFGKVHYALDGSPAKNVYVMLHADLSDSIVLQERPYYMTRTKEDGSFSFEYLRADTFQLFALEDKNYSFTYDEDVENFAFLDTMIVLQDSMLSVHLQMFKKEQSPKLLSQKYNQYGCITHVYDKAVDSLKFRMLSPVDWKYQLATDKDTMKLWYTTRTDSIRYIYGNDTLNAELPQRDTTFLKQSIRLRPQEVSIALWDSVLLIPNTPIQQMDTSRLRLYKLEKKKVLLPDSTLIQKRAALLSDSTRVATDSLVIDSFTYVMDTVDIRFETGLKGRYVYVHSKWDTVNPSYVLEIYPGAVTDIFERTNDTVTYAISINASDQYSSLHIVVNDLSDTSDYIVQLLKGDELIKTDYIYALPKDSVQYNRLPLGAYQLTIIEDQNGDRKWTSGDYFARRQPEPIKSFKLDELKPNFETRTDVYWNEKKKALVKEGDETPKEPEEKEDSDRK